MDTLSTQKRSERMALIRSKDTRPEMAVRSMIHRLGWRYRLHHSNLPGKPDLVFPRLRKVVFVHGCFWHRLSCKAGQRMPKSRLEYWQPKFDRTIQRDKINRILLKRSGWAVYVVWECQINDISARERLQKFLDSELS